MILRQNTRSDVIVSKGSERENASTVVLSESGKRFKCATGKSVSPASRGRDTRTRPSRSGVYSSWPIYSMMEHILGFSVCCQPSDLWGANSLGCPPACARRVFGRIDAYDVPLSSANAYFGTSCSLPYPRVLGMHWMRVRVSLRDKRRMFHHENHQTFRDRNSKLVYYTRVCVRNAVRNSSFIFETMGRQHVSIDLSSQESFLTTHVTSRIGGTILSTSCVCNNGRYCPVSPRSQERK